MRRTGLIAVTVCGVLVVLGMEELGQFDVLDRWGVGVFWSVCALVALGITLKRRGFQAFVPFVRRRTSAFWKWATSSPLRLGTLLGLGLFVAAIGVVAVSAPPNTGDSLTYHMGRVVHWVQNESTAIYPTAIDRQYEYPPFPEYVLTHLQILTGGDALANLVQFGAYLGCILVAGMIAQAMGLTPDGQLLAGIVVASIPMGVMQASSTQTDMVGAFWVVSAAYWMLVADEFPLPVSALLVGTSLALASFVKFPAAVFSLAILLWYLFRCANRFGRRRTLVSALTIIAALFVILQGPFYLRRAVFVVKALPRAPVVLQGPGISLKRELPLRYLNLRFDSAAIVSNLTRSAGLHLGLPNVEWNAAAAQLIQQIHSILRTDENDRLVTYPSGLWRGVRFFMHEDETGNFIHLLLALAAIGWIVAGRDALRIKWREYVGLVVLAAMLFILILKWQPWNSRLQTPWFVLTAPMIAVFLLQTLGRRSSQIASLTLLGLALPWLFWGSPRSLLGRQSVLRVPRTTQYFANKPEVETPFRNAIALIRERDCDQIGLVWGGDDPEYLVFALMAQDPAKPVRIEHVLVTNISQYAEPHRPPFEPCVILVYYPTPTEVTYHNTRYVRVLHEGVLSTFVKPTP